MVRHLKLKIKEWVLDIRLNTKVKIYNLYFESESPPIPKEKYTPNPPHFSTVSVDFYTMTVKHCRMYMYKISTHGLQWTCHHFYSFNTGLKGGREVTTLEKWKVPYLMFITQYGIVRKCFFFMILHLTCTCMYLSNFNTTC